MGKTKLLFAIAVFITFFTSCTNKTEEYIDPRGTDYAGSESCVQCHQTQSESTFHSSHFKATAPAIPENILGALSKGKNIFVYDKSTKLAIEERNDSLYQVLYKNGKEVAAHRFEIVFGSKHAQTSIYWRNNNTYELPLSYYTSVKSWATSPGFPSDKPYFDRKVVKDCYACHSSNISSRTINQSSRENNFLTMDAEDIVNKKTIVYGIDCERCHGPAKKHAEFHLKNPNVKIANYIVSYQSLSRQQKLDVCALCHAGNDGIKIKSRFEFKPGDKLSDYMRSLSDPNSTAAFDVHGNQYRLLAQSKCFIKSEKMDCITCHNPHENASQNLASYSKICLSCHQEIKHSESTLKSMPTSLLTNNCVECHMQKQSSNAIRFQLSNNAKMSNYILRTHKIAIYPKAENSK